ncbi:hypothetical protein CHUAL_012232 [Chamberlinius hualienensis]
MHCGKNLLDILSRDHERFKLCTIRNLKNNVLDQVQKYKTYDVAEATESGRENACKLSGEYNEDGSVSADESNQVYVESVYNVDSPMPDTFSTETPTCTERKFTKPSRKSRQTSNQEQTSV